MASSIGEAAGVKNPCLSRPGKVGRISGALSWNLNRPARWIGLQQRLLFPGGPKGPAESCDDGCLRPLIGIIEYPPQKTGATGVAGGP